MNERDFWIGLRRHLMGIVRLIEKRWGIAPKEDNSQHS